MALDQLLADLKQRLETNPTLAGWSTPFVVETTVIEAAGVTVEEKINAALNDFGHVVVIFVPSEEAKFKPTTSAMTDTIIAIEIHQNPNFTVGSSVTLLALFEEVIKHLHLYNPSNFSTSLSMETPVGDPKEEDGIYVMKTRWRITGSLTIGLPKVATPVTVQGVGVVTMSCATAGAAIFYTVDGGMPTPRNGTLYSGAVSLTAGQVVKARGWLMGYLSSDMTTRTAT
jgi:hypothetical protein